MKSKTTAYILWCGGLVGLCGLHRFYIGKVGTGLLWLFTLGLLGVGQLIDLFTLGGQVDEVNVRRGYGPGGNTQKSNQNVVVNVQTPSESGGDEDSKQADQTSQLERLVKLHEEGHLTEEEFEQQKQELFNS